MTGFTVSLMLVALANCQDAGAQPTEAELLLPRPSFQLAVGQRKAKAIPGSRETLFIRLGDISQGRVPLSIVKMPDGKVIEATTASQGDVVPFNVNGRKYSVRVAEIHDLLFDDFAVLEVSSKDPAAWAHPPATLPKPMTLKLDKNVTLEAAYIPPGAFTMGRDRTAPLIATAINFNANLGADEGPPHRVTISKGYLIGRFKVTNEQYCQFLNAVDQPNKYVELFASIEQRNGKYVSVLGKERSPADVVPFAGATAFCEWLAKKTGQTIRLPTEAEWEFAARGPEGRTYPWGYMNKDRLVWSKMGAAVDAFPETATPEGAIGMVDEVVAEWCSDFYAVNYPKDAQVDPKGPDPNKPVAKSDILVLANPNDPVMKYHVLRGRSPTATVTARFFGDTAAGGAIYGFRVVVELPKK